MAIVAIVVCLHGWRVTHQGGVGPIVSKMGIDGRCIWVIGSVLRCRPLVLFTSDTTHRQAYRKDILDQLVTLVLNCVFTITLPKLGARNDSHKCLKLGLTFKLSDQNF